MAPRRANARGRGTEGVTFGARSTLPRLSSIRVVNAQSRLASAQSKGDEMSVEKRVSGNGESVYRVRWRDGSRNRSRTFSTRRDALDYEAEIRRAKRAGTLTKLDAGTETLSEYVIGEWAPSHGALLAPKTRKHYTSLYEVHIAPQLAHLPLRDIGVDTVARWQADRFRVGAGPIAVSHAFDLLGSILQHAVRAERIQVNPASLVRKKPRPRRAETRPLSPRQIEKMRASASHRDAVLVSVLAYAGLRPGEALALRWGDLRERTIVVERALSLGAVTDTKTRQHRTVRLLDPLSSDLKEWRLASGRPPDSQLVFPGHDGGPWSEPAYQSWRRRAFRRAVLGAGLDSVRPYDLRHSFASLLIHEGRSVIYVARQLGHDARLTLSRYGHVMDELEDAPQILAEHAIVVARSSADAAVV
jgi:integrase